MPLRGGMFAPPCRFCLDLYPLQAVLPSILSLPLNPVTLNFHRSSLNFLFCGYSFSIIFLSAPCPFPVVPFLNCPSLWLQRPQRPPSAPSQGGVFSRRKWAVRPLKANACAGCSRVSRSSLAPSFRGHRSMPLIAIPHRDHGYEPGAGRARQDHSWRASM